MTQVIGGSGVVKSVSVIPGAIGYNSFGLAAAISLPSAAVMNADGIFVLPTPATISAAAGAFEAGALYPDGSASWAAVTLVNQPGM